MALDSTFLSELKFRCPVDEVIGGYVNLKRAGRRYLGPCPFHNEKTPSFTVFPDTSSYYCFGCGAGGDVITFIMKHENLDYMDAVRLLAQRAGLTMPEDKGLPDGRKKKRERMLEMHKIAARFYYSCLTEKPNPCMDYVKSRGLDAASVKRYGLGFAPDSFDALKNLLLQNKYSLAEMFEAGLVAKSQKNGSYYDKFRNRLMFPVIDLRGNVVAFSGRDLGDRGPKYLNSPDTEIYHKGDILFGLNVAKDKNEETLILCEGNIDVVMLSQAGFKNAIAPLGTAFTVEQARVIARYAKNVVIAFDSDNAGQKATNKAIDFLKGQGVTVRVLQMQGAKDPDEFIKTYGKERFATLVNTSKTPTEYRMDRLKANYNLSDTAQRMEYIGKCSDIIAALPSPVEREIYAGMLAKESEVSIEIMRADIERRHKALIKQEKKKEITRQTRELTGVTDNVNRERAGNMRAARSEEMLIAILVKNPDLCDFIKERIQPQEFVTAFNREVFEFYLEGLSQDTSAQSLSLSERFDEAKAARIAYIMNTAVLADDPRTQAEDCIAAIKKQGKTKLDVSNMSTDELLKLIQGDKK